MNAGIIYDDENVPTVSEMKLRERLQEVKVLLTHKQTLPELAEYRILIKKLTKLTGTPVL